MSAPPPYYGGYQDRGYGYYPQDHPQAMTILILGVLSLVVCGLLGPFAWAMGNTAIREIDQNPYAYTNRGTVQAGRICGIVSSCLLIFAAVVFAFVMVAVAASSA